MEILLCGFEPFGERDINNAWEVVKQFQGVPGIDILKLPVSFEKSHRVIIEALSRKYYDLILIMGETGFTTEYVRLERLAINYKDTVKPDNDGMIADDEEVIIDAPKAYFTSFPIKKIFLDLKEKGHKIKVTNSTGTFVCNSTYYQLLHYLSEHNLPQVALFVHLPASTQIVSLDEMEQTIKELIKIYKQKHSK